MKYEKIQDVAVITNVELPAEVAESNERNNRLDIRLMFRYKGEHTNTDKEVSELLKGIKTDLLQLAEKAGRNNTYSYLLDTTRLGYDPDSDNEKVVLKELKGKLENEDMVFTTYIVQVGELLKGTPFEGVTSVHTEKRAYSSFNASYLLVNDNSDNVCETMQRRLLSRIEDGTYYLGRTEADDKAARKAAKAATRAEED